MLSAGCRTIAGSSRSQQSIAARTLSRQGIEALHLGHREEAENLFENSLRISQVDDRAHGGYAESLWQRGEWKLAVKHMEQAVRLSGNDPEAQIRLGRMYLDLGRTAEAAATVEMALRANRKLAAGWALRGDVLARQDRRQDALAAYHQALALQPNMHEAKLAAAELYAHEGRHDRVLATLDQLRDGTGEAHCPFRAHVLRGLALQELGRADEASRCFALATVEQPQNVDLLYRWSIADWKAGNPQAAAATIERALRLAPENRVCQELAQQIGSEHSIHLAREYRPERFPLR
jgi:tetratricopeptide (TPR) repeat protein